MIVPPRLPDVFVATTLTYHLLTCICMTLLTLLMLRTERTSMTSALGLRTPGLGLGLTSLARGLRTAWLTDGLTHFPSHIHRTVSQSVGLPFPPLPPSPTISRQPGLGLGLGPSSRRLRLRLRLSVLCLGLWLVCRLAQASQSVHPSQAPSLNGVSQSSQSSQSVSHIGLLRCQSVASGRSVGRSLVGVSPPLRSPQSDGRWSVKSVSQSSVLQSVSQSAGSCGAVSADGGANRNRQMFADGKRGGQLQVPPTEFLVGLP